MAHRSPGADAPELHRLRSTITSMDSMSQNGFSQIAAIARFTLAWLDTPAGVEHPENVVHALRAIRDKADDIENCINAEAEEAGCDFVDPAVARRQEINRERRHA